MENETKKPVQTFREGAVGVSVWKRNGKNGEFFEYTLSRSYKKSEEEAGYAQSFREDNEQALVSVVGQAAAFIREQNEKEKEQAA
ncbi:MAG: hypothetical protein HY287_03570 [Planctomycetes bacterium]|nr:hypothetical protein [Planctomycetota bacterium]MBI3833390.1 hypothetical protein [Planctomycetota bacterium]